MRVYPASCILHLVSRLSRATARALQALAAGLQRRAGGPKGEATSLAVVLGITRGPSEIILLSRAADFL